MPVLRRSDIGCEQPLMMSVLQFFLLLTISMLATRSSELLSSPGENHQIISFLNDSVDSSLLGKVLAAAAAASATASGSQPGKLEYQLSVSFPMYLPC
jgi:hypothetical protein